MIQHDTAHPQITAVHADAPAERLFFAQYRLWMAGYCARDELYWDCAFDVLLRFVARESARVLHAQFHLFTRTLNEQARKEIVWRSSVCRCLCRDEYLVLRLVAASQRQDEETEYRAAMDLLGSEDIRPVLMASRSLAKALQYRSFVLAPVEHVSVAANMQELPPGARLH
ncbi:hypothetical protein CU048_11515 [Beijerinckiaceae bacterium]|nr:hypothetical protein CU048_11515 [Beijerinckiaceae bacterium]